MAIVIAVIFVFQNLKSKEENSEEAFQPGVSLNSSPSPSPLANQGLEIETIKQGSGEGAKAGDKITVHYTGTLLDGVKFDSSLDAGEPFVFTLGSKQVIEGWDQGILGMKVGEKRKLTIPPELGYGTKAVGPIPANATLIFEVEMLKIEK